MTYAAGETAPANSDEELERILAEREEAEQKAAEEAAKDLTQGKCPGCDELLEAQAVPAPIAAFVRRPSLKCSDCGLQAPMLPTVVGWALAMVVSAALALGGMSAIFSAQRLEPGNQQKIVFLTGALLFGGGLFVGYGVHGAGNHKLVAQRILKRRRETDEQKKQGDGKKKKKKKAAEEPSESVGEPTWFQENLEAVVVAIILALIIRHFAMEAFVIPTGSMAPTLLGDHFNVTCPNCDYDYPTSKSDLDLRSPTQTLGRLFCPVCEVRSDQEVSRSDVQGGHKILVNKFIYKVRPPRRYEIIVFKFPEHPWRNYIKRLIGLPGETLEIRNGDVFADRKLARKPDHVQDAVWIPVHDAAQRRKDGEPLWKPVNEGVEPPQVWTYDNDGFAMEARPQVVEGAPETAVVFQRELRDKYGYNRHGGSSNAYVADLRVRTTVTIEPGATVRLAIMESSADEGGRVYDRLLSAVFFAKGGSGPGCGIEIEGKLEAETSSFAGLTPGVPTELTLAYADDRARLQVNGETVLAWEDPYAPSETAEAAVRLSAQGAGVTFQRPRIDRDVYYVRGGGVEFDPSKRPVQVPSHSYFAMGDNSPNSEDGRRWGFVHEGNLIGRAFLVFWPVVPFELKFIR